MLTDLLSLVLKINIPTFAHYFFKTMQNIEAFKELISLPKRIVITTHVKPDADALGSSLGLSGILLKLGHQVSIITPTKYPDFLNWMEGNADIIVFIGNENKSAYLVENADIIFCLDFSSLSRIENLGNLVKISKAKKVLIDHHLDPEDFADFVLWSTEAAATAELVFDLIGLISEKDKITKGIAEALYAGIMTDTGNFKHSNTTPKIFRTVAELIEFGANNTKVSNAIYDSSSLNRLKLLGFSLSERLYVIESSKTAFIVLSKEDQDNFKYQIGDTEGFVNYGLSIKGVNMAAIFIEKKNKVKMSFRSIGEFSVNKLARDNFNGGGHKNAAGGISEDTLEATVEKFKHLVNKYANQLNYEL